ncbi:MAG TPA: RNA polymerase sigma factor region1.1 domain-containing protein, partial [Casimicrobiaceae bacterium]|nr:RNA polymerase sigma factor region1.1 domain-containing protein [Casimicrobiaceae bacterium]
MVKKHVKPARKSPGAAKGKSSKPARKPAAKRTARKPKTAATRTTARNAKRPATHAARKPATSVKGHAADKAHATKQKPVPAKVVAKPDKVAPPAKPEKVTVAKTAAPARPAAPVPAAAAKTVRKPSVGEIAAKIAGKRAEDAAHKKGKNGKAAEVAPRELTPADVEARKRRLKTLIVLGKERDYLTYAEINDHLPDDILDAEQIEGIISMIGDMGIQVYDEAPDAETLLMSEATPTAAAEDVEEEA